MDTTGRLRDVLIEDVYFTEPRTGVEMLGAFVNVWADAGAQDTIKAVAGVTACYNTLYHTRYEVYIDPRYDRETVKAEIEAAILCKE